MLTLIISIERVSAISASATSYAQHASMASPGHLHDILSLTWPYDSFSIRIMARLSAAGVKLPCYFYDARASANVSVDLQSNSRYGLKGCF